MACTFKFCHFKKYSPLWLSRSSWPSPQQAVGYSNKINQAGLFCQPCSTSVPLRISISWETWLACASDSNRCNKPAWIHLVWREPDMSFRTQRRWHRASLSGLCWSRLCFRFRISPFISLTFGIDSQNRSLLYKHPIKLNWSDAYAACPTGIGYLIYLSVRF